MKVQFIFSNSVELTYVLNDSMTTQQWVTMLEKMDSSLLIRNVENHIHGFATETEIEEKIIKLNSLLTKFKINPVYITQDTWKPELNKAHINFPIQVYGDKQYANDWHTINLLIHWLEYELVNVYDSKREYLINLDFNHSEGYKYTTKIVENEFNNFTPILKFGNLHLHYVYIGRHFLEIFNADDMVCPIVQFKPQHHFNATCGLVFSEPSSDDLLSQMESYYNKRGGIRFFGYDFNDIKLAKGFFKLGQLENISEYSTMAARDDLREKIQNNIIGWKIIK